MSIQRWAQTKALPQPAEVDGYSSENTSRAQTPLNTPDGSTTKLGPELENDTPKRAVYRPLKIISENSLDSALSDASKASDGKEEEEDDEEEDESSHAPLPESMEEKAEPSGEVEPPAKETKEESVGDLKEETLEESALNQSTPFEPQQEEMKLEELGETEEIKEGTVKVEAVNLCQAPETASEEDVERIEEQTFQIEEEKAKTEEVLEVRTTQSHQVEVSEAPSLAKQHEAGQAENTEAKNTANIEERLEYPSDCTTDVPPSSLAPEPSTQAPEAGLQAPEAKCEAPETGSEALGASSEAPESSLQAPAASSEAPEASLQATETGSEGPEASLQALEASSEAPDACTPTESTVAPMEPLLVGTPSQDEEEGPSDVESERSQEPQLGMVDISGLAARLLESWKDLKARWSKDVSSLLSDNTFYLFCLNLLKGMIHSKCTFISIMG